MHAGAAASACRFALPKFALHHQPAHHYCHAQCPENTYSLGGSLERCTLCGFGFSSRPGATSCTRIPNPCPPGTESRNSTSAVTCVCKPGFGGDANGLSCSLCPVSGSSCSLLAIHSHVTLRVPSMQPFVNPGNCCVHVQATNIAFNCHVACIAAMHLVQEGTYAAGGTRDSCLPCGFGLTSHAGSVSPRDCVETNHACPPGQAPPPGAASSDQCTCRPGFGGSVQTGGTLVCTLCAAGSYEAGGSFNPCTPCGFGFTSRAGATGKDQCRAIDACPAGTAAPPDATTVGECVCLPGHGGVGGADPTCSPCLPGSYATGTNGMEPCFSCGPGEYSPAMATSRSQCQRCPQVGACTARRTLTIILCLCDHMHGNER